MLTKYIPFCLSAVLALFFISCTTDVVPKGEPCQKVYAEVNDNHPMANAYQIALENFRKVNTIPGAVLLSYHPVHGLWIGNSGYADLAQGSTIQACDQFRVASITKTLIGTVVLQLHEEGKFELTAKLTELLPEVEGKIPYANQITIRQLLNHTSGIHDYQEDLNYRLDIFNNPKMATAKTSRDLLQDYVYSKPADFKPGESWRYSNSNYNLLELIIEKMEVKTAQQVLSQRLFKPLGMEGYFEVRNDAHLVRGYRDLYENGTIVSTTHWDPTDDGQGDGGFIGTAHDLFLFNHALFAAKLVNVRTLEDMKATATPDSDYGLALQHWKVGSHVAWGHAGQAYGFRSWMLYFPEKQVHMVLLTNLSNRPSEESFETLIDEILR
jgi:D-alanyl-D-alanine carboxypeptidase